MGRGRGATHALVFVGVVHEGCDAAAFDDVHGDVFVELGEGRRLVGLGGYGERKGRMLTVSSWMMRSRRSENLRVLSSP